LVQIGKQTWLTWEILVSDWVEFLKMFSSEYGNFKFIRFSNWRPEHSIVAFTKFQLIWPNGFLYDHRPSFSSFDKAVSEGNIHK
jgi:hypothetical protein